MESENAQKSPAQKCEFCKLVEEQLREKQAEIDTLHENLKSIKSKIIDSSKLLAIYTETKSENEVLKEQNKKLRDDFVLYKNENPIDVQITQYKEMKNQFDTLTNKCNVLQYTNEQLNASIENQQQTKEENEKLKTVIKEREKQIQNLKNTIAQKNIVIKEYYEKGGIPKITELENEIKILKEKNKGIWQNNEETKNNVQNNEILPLFDLNKIPDNSSQSIDLLIENKFKIMLKQAIPTIAKSVLDFNNLPENNRPRTLSRDSFTDQNIRVFESPKPASRKSSKNLEIKSPESKKSLKKRKIEEEKNEENSEISSNSEEIFMDIGEALEKIEANQKAEKLTKEKKNRKKPKKNDWIIEKKYEKPKVEEKIITIDENLIEPKKALKPIRKNLTLREIELMMADIMLVFYLYFTKIIVTIWI